jgi:hypothetical protein
LSTLLPVALILLGTGVTVWWSSLGAIYMPVCNPPSAGWEQRCRQIKLGVSAGLSISAVGVLIVLVRMGTSTRRRRRDGNGKKMRSGQITAGDRSHLSSGR